MADFKAIFTSDPMPMEVRFCSDTISAVKFDKTHIVTKYVGGELYEGDYAVTPKIDEQTIPTKDKFLVKDVTINPIPYFDVSNTSGGSTVYIGTLKNDSLTTVLGKG